MAGIKTLADGRKRLVILTAEPSWTAPVLASLTAGIYASPHVAKSGTRLSATASDTVQDPAYDAIANAAVPTLENYEGTIVPFAYFDDATGAYDAAASTVFEALLTTGTRLWLAERTGPIASTAFAAGDLVDIYEVVTDAYQESDGSGYIKYNVPLYVHKAARRLTVAAS